MGIHREEPDHGNCGGEPEPGVAAEHPGGGTWRDQFIQDVRWACRGLRRTPGSALAIVVLLALGMGGVAALFGPLYSVVLRPLPFPHSEQLVQVDGFPSLLDKSISTQATFRHKGELDRVFSSVTAYTYSPVVLSGPGPAVRVQAASVTSGFFETLGVAPRLGTSDIPGAVVSEQLWRERLHSAADLSKCYITLFRTRYPVIGVMPKGFDFPSGVQVWQLGMARFPVGRLRPGISIGQAQAYLKTLANQFADQRDMAAGGPVVESLHDALLGDRRPLLWMLFGISALFLALACAGAANLLLARSAKCTQEMLLRTVLGASRARLVRQLLMEALLLSMAGGLAGLGLSSLARHGLKLALPAWLSGDSFPPAGVALMIVLALAITLLCGLAPALHATGGELNSSVKAGHFGGLPSKPGRRMFTAHEWYTGGQLVLAMVLLGSTGLLLRSLYAQLKFPLGFEPKDVAAVKITLLPLPEAVAGMDSYMQAWTKDRRTEPDLFVQDAIEKQSRRNDQYFRDAMQRLSGLPGVMSAAVMNDPPLTVPGTLQNTLWDPSIGPRLDGKGVLARRVLTCSASADAFSVLGIRFLAGRTFQQGDIPSRWKDRGAPRVAIVSAATAKRLWPNQDPLGKIIMADLARKRRVIGVVEDIHESRNDRRGLPKVYTPFEPDSPYNYDLTFIVKLSPSLALDEFAAAVKRELPVASGSPPPEILPLKESDQSTSLALALLSCFSALGTVVAGLGVYATGTVMAATRKREMGVRFAMGATARQIGGLVLWRSLRLALFALPVGALGSWGLGSGLSHWLFLVEAADPTSHLASAVVLLAIALAAGLGPAIQATRADPLVSLRSEG